MRDFPLGRPCKIHLMRLSGRFARQSPETGLESVITPSIVAGELLVQIKYTLRLLKDWDISSIRENLPKLCPHLADSLSDSIFAQALRCRLSHISTLPCIECKKKKHCPKCFTSFQVDIRTLENLVTKVQVDLWRCLGSCESPFDSKWSRQAVQYVPKLGRRQWRRQN